jgi:hypothetical protein
VIFFADLLHRLNVESNSNYDVIVSVKGNKRVDERAPGANPTALSYNASVENIYSATISMARFCNRKYFSLE